MKEPLIIDAASDFDAAASVIERGGVVAYPTETFYALGADALNPAAVERVYELKGRDASSPLSILVSGEEMLEGVVSDVPSAALRLMKQFWPGPLTIVFRASSVLPERLLASTGTIGVRVSPSPVCRKLLAAVNRPLTATSANPSGKSPASSAAQASAYFKGSLDLVIDGGELGPSKGSSFVSVVGEHPVILRDGVIDSEELKRFF